MQRRPDHYTDEQKQWILAAAGQLPGVQPKEHELNELVLQLVRPTRASSTAKEVFKKNAPDPESSFEEQDFGFALGPGDIVIA